MYLQFCETKPIAGRFAAPGEAPRRENCAGCRFCSCRRTCLSAVGARTPRHENCAERRLGAAAASCAGVVGAQGRRRENCAERRFCPDAASGGTGVPPVKGSGSEHGQDARATLCCRTPRDRPWAIRRKNFCFPDFPLFRFPFSLHPWPV